MRPPDDALLSARRERLRSDASRLLASASDDYGSVLAELTQLIVSTVADWCVIHLVRRDGSVQRIAPRYDDPATKSHAGSRRKGTPPG